ncbi:nucleoside triphosphatase YtkD [Oceanobacillus piezotolerans]|uniref:Nucleoside triphosphatase YtkD n=1 Tax=Oceanobacillus piezotolerans TaxID=2448030 RepID=A0A498DBY3_9BACI|nr:nucleoside triphosphatase YtkD [Oceanobacillus piezotolerans]RLL46467.1 nucleoside triphosphatase YtkD [Oceanobacillus piezotolerans]
MKTFRDYYNNEVKLSFEDHPFSENPKHVLVICRFQNKWLLTKHKGRGLEFPGGKVEAGETAEQAAVREVMEETGGTVKELHYIGQYYVDGKSDYVIKNVYFANVEKLESQLTYYETDGPHLLDKIPKNIRYNNKFSFIMKDGVLEYCLGQIQTVPPAIN